MLRFLVFLLRVGVGKTVALGFVATLSVSLVLAVAPPERELRVRVRAIADTTLPESEEETLAHAVQTSIVLLLFRLEEDTQEGWRKILRETIAEDLMALKPEQQAAGKESSLTVSPLKAYFRWLYGLVWVDFGRARSGQSINEEVLRRFPVSLRLSLSSILLSILLGLGVGILTHARQKYISVRLGVLLIYLASSLPAFFLGYILVRQFSLDLSLHPSYWLPVITLTLSSNVLAEMTLVVRGALAREENSNYVRTAVVKGLKENSWLPIPGTVFFHVFRAAVADILAEMSLKIPFIISASIVVEKVFSLPGLGDMLLDGLGDRDVPRVLTVVLLAIVLVRLGSLLAETSLYLLNPRMRTRGFHA